MVMFALMGSFLAHADTGMDMDSELRSLRQRLQAVEQRLEMAEAQESAGSKIIAEGELVDDVVYLKGPISVFGEVEGDAVVLGHDLTIEDGGRVRGDAVSLGGSVIVEPGGIVDGEILGRTTTEAVTGSAVMNPTEHHLLGPIFHRISLLLSLAAGLVLVGGLFPNGVHNVEQRLSRSPISSAIWGIFFGGLFCTAGLVFAVTVIGLPITFIAFSLLGCAALLGMSALAQFLGSRIVRAKSTPAWVTILVGTLLCGAIFALPYVGPIVMGLALLTASGAAWASRLGRK